MPPVTVSSIKSDGASGWFIHWHDEANLNGLPIDGYFHLSDVTCGDLFTHCIRPNNAPATNMNKLEWAVHSGKNKEMVATLFCEAYGEIIETRIARHRLGLKAVTSHGHQDLEAVQLGEPVRPWNAVNSDVGFHEWIEGQRVTSR